MQRWRARLNEGSGITWVRLINIFEGEHFVQSFLVPARKATPFGEIVSVLEGTEESIPDRQVAEVEVVNI